MSVKWNGMKLLKTIADNEAAAAKFYKTIASEARIGEGFFDILAKDEERHEGIYKALLDKHAKDVDVEIDENDAGYMDSLVDNNLVFDEELIEKAKNIYTKDQIFDLAEKAERDTVMYVIELQRLYPDLAKDEMKIILKEEKAHLKMVLDRKKENRMSVNLML